MEEQGRKPQVKYSSLTPEQGVHNVILRGSVAPRQQHGQQAAQHALACRRKVGRLVEPGHQLRRGKARAARKGQFSFFDGWLSEACGPQGFCIPLLREARLT